MNTPHGRHGRNAELNHVPAPWWKQKQGVADKVGNALIVALAPPVDIRRVVGRALPTEVDRCDSGRRATQGGRVQGRRC